MDEFIKELKPVNDGAVVNHSLSDVKHSNKKLQRKILPLHMKKFPGL